MVTVNLLEFFPWTWIMHFTRALISFNIVFTVLKSKYSTSITFFSLIIPSLIYSFVTISLNPLKHETLAMFVYYILQFTICCLVTEGKLFSKLFSVIFSLVSYLGGALIFSALRIFDPSVVFSYELPLSEFLLEIVCIYSFSFISVALIKLIQNKTRKSLQYRTKLVFLFLFPATHLLCIFGAFAMILSLNQEQRALFYQSHVLAQAVMIICCIICMIIDFSILFVADHIEKVEEKNINTQKELVKNKMEFQQIEMLKEEKKEFRKIKHDLANIITTAKGFIEIGKPEKAMSVLQGTNDNLMGLAGFSLCSNETINTIIYIKQQQAKNSGINMTAEIEENTGVLIDDYDLCRILSNIIDNALNAVRMTDEKKICHIAIEINDEQITIKSQNNFDPEKKSKRKKSELHGNGIGIIKEIASKYGGEYSATQENDVWYAEATLDNKSPANSTPPPNFGLITYD